jgi:hypothetical protein
MRLALTLALCGCVTVGCGFDPRGTAPDDVPSPNDATALEAATSDGEASDGETPLDPDAADGGSPSDGDPADAADAVAPDTIAPDTASPDTNGPDVAPTDGGPPGFSVVTVVTGACPSGWGAKRVLLAAPRDPGTGCTCSCGGGGPNPCLHDSLTIDYRTGSSNCNDGKQTIDADGACHALPPWPSGTNGASGAPLAPKVTGCPATATLPPLAKDGTTEVCVAATPKPPDVTTPICYLRDGDVACPAGATNKKVLIPQSRVTDGRTCGACSCASKATSCSASITFATDDKCSTGTRTVSLSSSCTGISGSGSPTHYRYSGTPNTLACAPSSATVPTTGTVGLGTPVTLCCP